MTSAGGSRHSKFRPYALLHPISLLSIGLLLVNDHVLKALFSNAVTGKLSDFAGLVFFPLLLSMVVSATVRVFGRRPIAEMQIVAGAIVVTGLVFLATNTLPVAETIYEHALGGLQAPVRWLGGRPPTAVDLTRDPTDLVALVALIVAWTIARRGNITGAETD